MPLNDSAPVPGPGLKRVPVLGFLVCLYLWLSLGTAAKMAGFVWLAPGVLYGAWRTSWFRKPMDFARISSEEEPALAAPPPALADR